MKKQAFRNINPIASESLSGSVPAPIGGWNTRDSIAAMAPTDAVILDNWYPFSTGVNLRKGNMDYATGFPTRVQTILSYSSPTLQQMFGATAVGIYDATAGGAVGAAVTPLTNGYCQFINFATAAGNFLLSVNGLDKLKLYNGATWADIDGVSVPAITGLATTSIINISAFKNRIWFVQRDSMDIWYLPVASIGGAATKFPLGGLFTRGGYLMAMGTWTIDGGNGVDDFAVFATSEGEIAVYQGTDPSSPTTWALVGVYYIGEPIGRRCFTKYGGDLLYLCRNGLFPLSKALQTSSIDRTMALSDKISPTFSDSATQFGDNLGWQTTLFPAANMVIVNVPAYVGTASYQYVMNSINQSWCRFLDQNAACFFVWDSRLFYGSETTIVEAWTGPSDNGNFITGVALTGYSYLQNPSSVKHFKLMRPIIQTNSSYDLSMGVAIDFEDASVEYTTILASLSGSSLWDTALWDTALWGAGMSITKFWTSLSVNPGNAVAAKLQVRTKLSTATWLSTDFVYEVGGIL